MRKRSKGSKKLQIFLALGVVLSLVFILIFSTVGRRNFSSYHRMALETLGTIQHAVFQGTGGLSFIWRDYFALWNVRQENQLLTEKLREAQALIDKNREAVATNMRLTSLLELKETLPAPTLTARVIGRDPSIWFKTIIIDRGSSDGIMKGMPAVLAEGVIGQVLDSAPHYSKILLANDPNSAIDALVQESRVQGMIKGRNSFFSLEYVLKNYEIKIDELVVTSGIGGTFPKGLPIGKVSKVTKNPRGMFQEIEVTSEVDFNRLEYVIILLAENPLAL
ncbi:MAG: rod shape-determining protein MreC [Deltaproteobacteria bacterium RIFOXYD12_FULL_50_9]|nr:MAG: rod shape-determining protein MreC [Deltaproteobacteria bacterium RIFOXYD12_FULL_50_9]